jgi:hypothetical protein
MLGARLEMIFFPLSHFPMAETPSFVYDACFRKVEVVGCASVILEAHFGLNSIQSSITKMPAAENMPSAVTIRKPKFIPGATETIWPVPEFVRGSS